MTELVTVETIAMGAAAVGVLATAVYVGAIGWGAKYLRRREAREAEAGGELRRLVDETVATQRALVDELAAVNAELEEIERVLKEV